VNPASQKSLFQKQEHTPKGDRQESWPLSLELDHKTHSGERLKMKSQRELIKEGKTSFYGGIYNCLRNLQKAPDKAKGS
jgi:hypothetical protein